MGKNKPQTSATADSSNSEANGLATLVSVTFHNFHRKKLTIDQLIQKSEDSEYALIREEMKANLGKITKENESLKSQLEKMNAEVAKLRKVDKPKAKESKSKKNKEESLKSDKLTSLSTALAKATERSNVLHELTTALKLLNDAIKLPSNKANSNTVNTALEALEHLNNKVNQRHQTIVLSTLLVQKAAELRQKLNADSVQDLRNELAFLKEHLDRVARAVHGNGMEIERGSTFTVNYLFNRSVIFESEITDMIDGLLETNDSVLRVSECSSAIDFDLHNIHVHVEFNFADKLSPFIRNEYPIGRSYRSQVNEATTRGRISSRIASALLNVFMALPTEFFECRI
ncbi:hypothetical protein M3Y96_01202100 [Aphelenchoides besseyi]|nr:hypothetical protein M3Y96_01202100 [Aphelenchoides besseyi]